MFEIALLITGLSILVVGLSWGLMKDSPDIPTVGPVMVMLAGLATVLTAVWMWAL